MAESNDPEIMALTNQLRDLEAQREAIEARLATLSQVLSPEARSVPPTPVKDLTQQEKVALFRKLFAGRPDVFALRWDNAKDGRSGYAPACSNEWAAGICGKPKIKCGICPNQAFIPVSDEVIKRHLRGYVSSSNRRDFVMGAYPLLQDDTCWFLAADFDGEQWATDALAYVQTCNSRNVPAALERSRSGQGGHVWIFFSEPIAAREARQLGAALMTETMERRPEIGFASYDRFFPNQDFMPAGGFGNLIALPLARRTRDRSNSIFVDDKLEAYEDQWTYLATLQRMAPAAVSNIVREAQEFGRVLGVRMPVDDDESDEPWLLPPSRRHPPRPITGTLPKSVSVVLSDGIYIDRSKLPPEMVARLVRVAAFANPEFFRAQAMRLPTYGKPRIISCAELHPRHVALPRGCLDEAVGLLRSNSVGAIFEDQREFGSRLDLRFLGTLHAEQQEAFDAVIEHDFGVLPAPTAFGKTVIAAAAIAHRGRSTLILVHRRELLTQWIERLKTFLSLDSSQIGTIGGGRRKPTGHIDVALVQSLVRKGEVSDLVGGYGHLIVDECHHISASTFEIVARRSKARYVLGSLTTSSQHSKPGEIHSCSPNGATISNISPQRLRERRGISSSCEVG